MDHHNATIAAGQIPPLDACQFDGVLCFGGEDWWYHNRGHFDMQLMCRLAHHVPVLYVNSIGMRTPRPREGRMFLSRFARKFRSVQRGLVRIDDRFSVLSAPFLPGRLGTPLLRGRLARAVRDAMAASEIRHPLIWIACPTAAEVLDDLNPVATVYQRTDRYEAFADVDSERIRAYDRWLKRRADVTIFCARQLMTEESFQCADTLHIDHGVDFNRFCAAGRDQSNEPDEFSRLPRPRVGFVGGIDAHTFDPDLFRAVAVALPEVQFVLTGACSLPAGWCKLEHVTMLGRKPYEVIPSYMAACDVLIMPWRRSRWIEACNPVKLKEYLATGRPVVSTPFPELERYHDHVRIASDADSFAEAIRESLRDPGDADAMRRAVCNETWDARITDLLEQLAIRGIRSFDSCPSSNQSADRTPARNEIAASFSVIPQWQHSALIEPKPIIPKQSKTGVVGILLLDGGPVSSNRLRLACQSPLDLKLTDEYRVLDHWTDHAQELEAATEKRISVRVLHDHARPIAWPHVDERTLFERDARPLRGTAGLVRDACRAYQPRESVLVVEATRLPLSSLLPFCAHHDATGADVTIAMNSDQTPAGVYLIRCAALECVPSVGYADLKEQTIPALRASDGRIETTSLLQTISIDRAIDAQIVSAVASGTAFGSRGVLNCASLAHR